MLPPKETYDASKTLRVATKSSPAFKAGVAFEAAVQSFGDVKSFVREIHYEYLVANSLRIKHFALRIKKDVRGERLAVCDGRGFYPTVKRGQPAINRGDVNRFAAAGNVAFEFAFDPLERVVD